MDQNNIISERAIIKVYRGDRKTLMRMKWWLGKSDMEIVTAQLYIKDLDLICDSQVFLKALSNVLGRPVYPYELSNQYFLLDEFEKKYPITKH